MSNVAKVAAWWREIDWPACVAFTLPGIPAAALGARTLLTLDTHVVDVALGVFFLAMIPTRHWLESRARRSLAIFASKVTTFHALGALPGPAIVKGLIIGTSVMAGSSIGKTIVQRMSRATCRYILDTLLFASGVTLLWAAI